MDRGLARNTDRSLSAWAWLGLYLPPEGDHTRMYVNSRNSNERPHSGTEENLPLNGVKSKSSTVQLSHAIDVLKNAMREPTGNGEPLQL